MSLYYINPIVWNTNGYQRPSGVNFTSGYPKEHGFGHEEWNNSPLLAIEEKGEKFRVFHTEGLGNELIDDYPEDIFLLMIASHDRGQYLVGVAGGATSFFSDRKERERLVREHWHGLLLIANLDALFDDANSDSVLITFEDSGEMLISESLSAEERIRLGIPQRLRQPLNESQRKYLSYHRQKLK